MLVGNGYKALDGGAMLFRYQNGSGQIWGTLYINGILVYDNGSGGNYGDENERESGLIKIDKGEVVTVSVTNASYTLTFFPYKK